MSLTTHILVAAVVAKPIVEFEPGSWWAIFIVAFASHFLADAIPHWDYSLASLEGNEGKGTLNISLKLKPSLIITDMTRVGFDIAVGSLILLVVYQPHVTIASIAPLFFAALGGILPDALQPVYWLWKQSPLRYLQRFHHFMHAHTQLSLLPFGAPSQLIIITVCVLILQQL